MKIRFIKALNSVLVVYPQCPDERYSNLNKRDTLKRPKWPKMNWTFFNN